jgi:hypothetical protein
MSRLGHLIRGPSGGNSVAGKDGAANTSPPPCGEGVVQCGTSLPLGTTPHPNPPSQGGRESSAARPGPYFRPVGAEGRI